MSIIPSSSSFRRARLMPLAAPAVIAAALAGCSTDVQRFGHTGSLAPASTLGAAPVGVVERAPLGLTTGPSRSASGSSYANSTTPAGAVSVASVQNYASGSSSSVLVQPGDTAFSIARRNRVSVQQLAAANDLGYPYDIKIGQRLTIPAAGAPAVAAAAPAPVRSAALNTGSHTVVPGDTLFNISRRYGVGVASLAETNNLDDYGTIKIGQTLRLPSGSAAPTTAAGGPLKLAARDVDAAANTGARVLQSRAIETGNAAANSGGQASVAPAAGASEASRLLPPASATTAKFRWPARGRIISNYGVASNGKRNDGINISVPVGASVKAAESGVVAYAGDELKGYGNLILIRHANDWVTAYAHNSSLLVKRGDQVKRGQIIAKAGQTGSVDKPQLHFEVRQGSKAVDPMPYLEGA